MSYQSTHLHIMDMRFSGVVSTAAFEQWLVEVEAFLQQQQHFVLIMQTAVKTMFPAQYRQIQAHWYKKNKAYFFQYCLGLVRVAQDQDDQDRLNKPALHAAWQVPYYVTLTYADALQWAVQRWICRI